MIEFDFATYIKSRAAITALVGTRVYEGRAPQTKSQQKVNSRIVYELLEGSERHYHSLGASGLVEADIQLHIVGETYVKAREIYEALRDEIDGFRGAWGEREIDRCVLSTPSRASADPSQGDDTGYPAVKAVVEIHYQESIPTLA